MSFIVKTLYFLGISLGMLFIFLGIFLFVTTTSSNSSYKEGIYIPKAQAKLNFFQDELQNENYIELGKSFWASEKNYNQSFGTVKITLGTEPTTVPKSITDIITVISRDSH